jgi:hypothetical protein
MANTEDTFQVRKFRHFVYVAEPADGTRTFYGVMTIYAETDAINAKGQVWRFDPSPDAPVTCSLNTNDDLNTIWASPQNHLWVGSGWGNVWTTAPTGWTSRIDPKFQWTNQDPSLQWRAAELPRAANRRGYVITALWGSSDHDVHVATFNGTIFHWDGSQWTTKYRSEAETPLTRMHGSGPDDFWAVGRDGLALHYDGQTWRRVPLPGDETKGQWLVGVWARSPDEVYMCSTSGVVFHGSRHGLERLGEYPYGFYGIVDFNDALYLAGGDAGAIRLDGNKASVVRKTFASTGIYRLQNRIAFVQPMQDNPCIIVHDPNDPRPWIGHFC